MVGRSRAISAEKYRNIMVRDCILEHFGALWALLGRTLTTLGTVLTSTWGLQALFFTILWEKSDLCISTPLSNGIASLAGPGNQVGATCVQKSHPIGPKCFRTGKLQGPGQSNLASRLGRAVRVMETERESSANPSRTMGTQFWQSRKSI